MAPSNMVLDTVEDLSPACADDKLDPQTRTPLSAWAPSFAPNSTACLEDSCDSLADWVKSSQKPHTHKDGNVYVFNFDLVSDDESESDDEFLLTPSVSVLAGRPACPPPGLEVETGKLIDPPPGLEAVGAPPGLAAVLSKSEPCWAMGAPPGLDIAAPKIEPCVAMDAPPGLDITAPKAEPCVAASSRAELQEDVGLPPGLEVKQRTAWWWRKPCPFNVPQNIVREPALSGNAKSRPWRHMAGSKVAHSLVPPSSLDHGLKDSSFYTAVTEATVLKPTASESDLEDADTTGSFTTEDVDSE